MNNKLGVALALFAGLLGGLLTRFIAPPAAFAQNQVSAPKEIEHVVLGQERHGFDVASVRPTVSADGRALFQATPGRLAMSNLALRRLILIAYDIQDYQLIGNPSWIDSEHYDIQARADGNPTVQQMEGPMLQALLEERFKLLLHRETRQLSVYKLSVGKSGAKMQTSQEGNCTPYVLDAPPPTTKPEESRPIFCDFQRARLQWTD